MSEKSSAPRKPGFFAQLAQKIGLKKEAPINGVSDPEISEFARIAKEKGYIDDNQAEQLTEMASGDPENTSSDLVVQQDWMTESQAEVVCIEQAKTDPNAHLDDQFKRAEKALDETHTEIKRLKDATSTGTLRVSDVLSAKKKAEGSG